MESPLIVTGGQNKDRGRPPESRWRLISSLSKYRYLAISGERREVTVLAFSLFSESRADDGSALTRATVGVMGSVRTGMLRVAAVTVRVSAFTYRITNTCG